MRNEIKDERIEQNKAKALANAAIIGEVLLLIKVSFEIFTGKATLGTTGWDIALLTVMNIVKSITLYRSKTIDLPKTLFGKPLTTGDSIVDKHKRFYKSYIPESFVGALGLTAGSYFNSGYNGLAPTIILYIIYFGFYLAFSYFNNEHNIKRYNKDLED